MVTGELPFKSTGPLDAWMKKIHNELVPPRQLIPALSERLDWAIQRAMNADPTQRPTSCREFVEDLTGSSTRRAPVVRDAAAAAELWYLVYKDEEGEPHTVKGSTKAIRRSLKEGLLGDAANIRAARNNKQGPFEALRMFPEFRDLVVTSPQMPTSGRPQVPLAGSNTTQQPLRDPTVPRRKTAAVPRVAPPPAETEPHIVLDTGSTGSTRPKSGGDGFGWLGWILVIAVVIATSVAVTYFFLRPR